KPLPAADGCWDLISCNRAASDRRSGTTLSEIVPESSTVAKRTGSGDVRWSVSTSISLSANPGVSPVKGLTVTHSPRLSNSSGVSSPESSTSPSLPIALMSTSLPEMSISKIAELNPWVSGLIPIADSPVYPASCRDDPPLVIYALQEATPVADMEMPSHTPSSAVGEDAARYSRHVCAVPVVAVSISTCISADMGGSPACTDSLLIPTGRATVPSDSHEPLPLHVAPEKEDAPTTSPGVRKSSKVTSPGCHGKVEPAGPIE